jgi:hypothetical protein
MIYSNEFFQIIIWIALIFVGVMIGHIISGIDIKKMFRLYEHKIKDTEPHQNTNVDETIENEKITINYIHRLIDKFHIEYRSQDLRIGSLNFDKVDSLVVYESYSPIFIITPDKIFTYLEYKFVPVNVIFDVYEIFRYYKLYVTEKIKEQNDHR